MKINYLPRIAILILFVCISTAAFTQENLALKADNILTSHVSAWEDLFAIKNGIEPTSSTDKNGGAYGNWNGENNLWHWVEYNWNDLYVINRSDVYWWTDGGGIQIPYETYQEYWDFQKKVWAPLPVVSGNGIAADRYNETACTPVLTNKIRVNMVSTISTGILEWKVWGVLGEQVPMESTSTIDIPLAKASTSNVLVTARKNALETVSGYVFKADINVKNDISNQTEVYLVNGIEYTSNIKSISLTPSSAEGEVSFSISIPASIDYRDGISVQLFFNDGYTKLGDAFSIYEPGLAPPALFADVTSNTVDNSIEISFANGPLWQSVIKNIYANGVLLNSPVDYEILDGIILLKPSGENPLLTTSGTKTISIESSGYEDISVVQPILPGEISVLNTSVKTQVSLYMPTSTKIEIIAKDSYGNSIEAYSFGYDILVTNSNTTTNETYLIANTSTGQSLTGQTTSPTNSSGYIAMPISIPRAVDLHDGIKVILKLSDGSLLNKDIQFINDGTGKEIVLQAGVKSNAGFSWDRTAQSENFIVYWGEKIIGNPTDKINGNIAFDPLVILQTLEDLLAYFNDSIGFIANPNELNMGKFKHEVVINETWNSGFTGYAFGGWADEKIGGMWVAPWATNGPAVLAHEFTHMNQCMVFLQYPGRGLNMPYSGFFWESHANYMMKNFTDTYTGVNIERYIFTSMMHYSTTRRRYENVYFLDYLADKYGMQTVNDIWRKADPKLSHPLTSLRDSVLKYSQSDLNDDFGEHAMKNVTWDYSGGAKIKSAIKGIDPIFVQRMYTILDSVKDEPGKFVVPEYLAPGDYGYNIIQLFPDAGSNTITIDFEGTENSPSGGAGWRYGFVGVDNQGIPRYSPLYSLAVETITFSLSSSDSAVFFVVTGAPEKHHNYAWEAGYPKVYRYPYTITIQGAIPGGHKPGYNKPVNIQAGAPHANGGGWVSSTASVDPTAYVGQNAQVLDQAKVLNNARIEGFAIVNENAIIRNDAIVRDHSIVGKGSIVSNYAIVEKSARVFSNSVLRDYAVATGSALLYNSTLRGNAVAKDLSRLYNATISGTAIIGGDAEDFTTCSAGTYQQIPRTATPDGLIDHPANLELNPVWPVYVYPKGEKPAPPQNLIASDVTGHSVTLNWKKAGDFREVESYYLYYDGVFKEIVSGTEKIVTGLTPLRNYSFAIKAVDRSGNVSAYSEILQVTTIFTNVDIPNNTEFIVFPNPSSDVINLESAMGGESYFVIKDILGCEVLSGTFKNSITINKSEIGPAGIYFVMISCNSAKQVTKIIIS